MQVPVGSSDTLLDNVQAANELSGQAINVAPAEGSKPLGIFPDKHSEELGFPKTFCGMARPADRPTKVSYADIVKWVLRNTDRRAANSTRNICFKMKKHLIMQVSHAVWIRVRRGRVKGITVAQARNRAARESLADGYVGYKELKQLTHNQPSPTIW